MKKRPLIGLISPVLARNHTRNIVRGAIAQAHGCGCDVIVLAPLIHFTYCTKDHAAAEEDIFSLIGSGGFDGFLYIKDDTTMGSEVIRRLEERLVQSHQYVMTVDEREHPVFDSTQYDDYDDFGRIVEHLIEVHGYRRIHCLTGPADSFQARTRLRAYQDKMSEHGLFYDESCYTYGTFWVDSAMAYAESLLSGERAMPEAIVCGNDIMAMSLIKTLQAGGIRVPEDVAVTGYDGFPFSANVEVTLTTYARNHFQLGADAVRRLFRNMTGIVCSKVRRPDSGLLIGNSCGCTSIPARQLLPDASAAVPKMWEEDVFADDMAFDLSLAESVPDALHRALRHSRILYQVKGLQIYLFGKQDALHLAASCGSDGMPEPLSPTQPAVTAASQFLRGSDAPEVLFLSPLHLHRQRFGMIALSFEAPDRVYDRNYLHFVSTLETTLARFQEMPPEPALSGSAILRNTRLGQISTKLHKVHENLTNAPELQWSVEMLCLETGLPRSTLQKHYKELFGVSIFEDLIRIRVERAKQLLQDTSLSLTEISARCGYTTESYFMKQFKKLTGMTPSEYRRSLR